MNKQANYFEIIEKYLNGLMSEQEIREFEQQLRSDPELAMEYGRHMEILNTIKDKERIELRSQLRHTWYDYKEKLENRGNIFRQSRIYWVAATLLLLMSISLVVIGLFGVDPLHKPKMGFLKDRKYSLTKECEEIYAVNTRQNGFSLIQPSDSADFYKGQPIKFQWATDPKRSVYMDILDRKGKIVISFNKMPDCEYEYLLMENRGVYLYRFRDGNDVLKQGIFYVK